MKKALFVILSLALLITQGCIIVPFPHTRLHAYGVQGRIVDADGNPVPNVTVSIPAQKAGIMNVPKREAITDSDGRFKIKAVHGWHGARILVFAPTGGENMASLFPFFDAFHDRIGLGWKNDKLRLHADGFPAQQFTPLYWEANWKKVPVNDTVFVKGKYIMASKIMLHRPTTSNLLSSATHTTATNNLNITSIVLSDRKIYSSGAIGPKRLEIKHTITDTNVVAKIVSEISVPATMTTLAIPDTDDAPRDDVLCSMVFRTPSGNLNMGCVVKQDGTILNSHIWWIEYSNGFEIHQYNADVTWSFHSEAIVNLVREILDGQGTLGARSDK